MLNRGRRVFAALVVLVAVVSLEANAAGLRPSEVTDPASSAAARIERPAREIAYLPGRVRKLVIRLFHELTIPIPAPKP